MLVAGDMCSDIEMPLLDPDMGELADPDPAARLAAYRDGLGKLAALAGVRQVVPGHGPCR